MKKILTFLRDHPYSIMLQGAFVPLAPTPENSPLGQIYKSTDLSGFISGLFTAAISIGGILAVLRLSYAGYIYMTKDAWSSKISAKDIIGDTVLGLLLLLSIWLILHQINPNILKLDVLNSLNSGASYNPGAGATGGAY